MTYAETLDFLYHRLPMFSRVGIGAYKKDLTNTLALCEALGNPHQKFRSVHIAGTNGKGSVSHMLAAILQSAGYKTGLYTSPHLVDFGERIRINGEMISEQWVVDFTEKVMPLLDSIEPSFFELTVAMAFSWFSQQRVDVAVIETGLGGRLDSTNVILPELSIITNIGWDHANILGDSLEKIASEKAGIIKPRVPVVVGESDSRTRSVFEKKAEAESTPLVFADHQFLMTAWDYQHHRLQMTVEEEKTGERENYILDLTGFYQTKNVLAVLSAVQLLRKKGFSVSQEAVHEGLGHVRKLTGFRGRWEAVHLHPDVILDVAHNEDGIRQLTAQLELTAFDDLHIVFGMVKDKDPDRVIALLPKAASYYFTRAQIPRALPEQELKEKASKHGLEGKTFPDVNSAIRDAMQHASKNSLILVCGSVFVVGEVDLRMFH